MLKVIVDKLETECFIGTLSDLSVIVSLPERLLFDGRFEFLLVVAK